MGSLLLEARENRARRGLAALVESLEPSRLAELDADAIAALAEFASRHEGTTASREARDRMAKGAQVTLDRINAALTGLDHAPPEQALAVMRELEPGIRGLSPRPSQDWLDAWTRMRSGFQQQLSSRLSTILDKAAEQSNQGRPDLALRELADFAASTAREHLTTEDEARLESDKTTHASALEAAMADERRRAATTRIEYVRQRGQASLRTLEALRPLVAGASTGHLAKLVESLKSLRDQLPAHDRPACALALSSATKAMASLDWMAESLRTGIGSRVTLRVLLPDRGGERSGECTVTAVDGHLLTVSGLAGIPRTEVWVHDLHPAMWMDRIDLLSPSARSQHHGNLAHWLRIREHPHMLGQLASLVPADDVWVTASSIPIESLIHQLATHRAVALLMDGRPIPPEVQSLGFGQHGAPVIDATQRMTGSAEKPPTAMVAATIAEALVAVPAGLHNPAVLAWLIPRLPAATDLALILQSHVPTDPLAAVSIGQAMLADKVPAAGLPLGHVRTALAANPLDPGLAHVASRLGIQ
jgi:hypothetical protein